MRPEASRTPSVVEFLLHAARLTDDPPEDSFDPAMVKRSGVRSRYAQQDLPLALGIANIPPEFLLELCKIERKRRPLVKDAHQLRIQPVYLFPSSPHIFRTASAIH